MRTLNQLKSGIERDVKLTVENEVFESIRMDDINGMAERIKERVKEVLANYACEYCESFKLDSYLNECDLTQTISITFDPNMLK